MAHIINTHLKYIFLEIYKSLKNRVIKKELRTRQAIYRFFEQPGQNLLPYVIPMFLCINAKISFVIVIILLSTQFRINKCKQCTLV